MNVAIVIVQRQQHSTNNATTCRGTAMSPRTNSLLLYGTSSGPSRIIIIINTIIYSQWRRHGVDWGGHGLGWTCPPHFCPRSFLRLTQILVFFCGGGECGRGCSCVRVGEVTVSASAPPTCPLHYFTAGDAPVYSPLDTQKQQGRIQKLGDDGSGGRAPKGIRGSITHEISEYRINESACLTYRWQWRMHSHIGSDPYEH